LRTSPSSEPRWRALARALDAEQRLAAIAAIALAGSLFLPWWHDPGVRVTVVGVRRLSFIEAAIFLVAVAVLVLLLRRAEGKAFHLPLSDGTLIAASGAWATFLVLFRMLDPPTRTIAGTTSDYGMRWGLLIALAGAVLLAASGARARPTPPRGAGGGAPAHADATPTVPLPR
jgi:hypothetical protein